MHHQCTSRRTHHVEGSEMEEVGELSLSLRTDRRLLPTSLRWTTRHHALAPHVSAVLYGAMVDMLT